MLKSFTVIWYEVFEWRGMYLCDIQLHFIWYIRQVNAKIYTKCGKCHSCRINLKWMQREQQKWGGKIRRRRSGGRCKCLQTSSTAGTLWMERLWLLLRWFTKYYVYATEQHNSAIAAAEAAAAAAATEAAAAAFGREWWGHILFLVLGLSQPVH